MKPSMMNLSNNLSPNLLKRTNALVLDEYFKAAKKAIEKNPNISAEEFIELDNNKKLIERFNHVQKKVGAKEYIKNLSKKFNLPKIKIYKD